MNRETANRLLPVIMAFARGIPVQTKVPGSASQWEDIDVEGCLKFDGDPRSYRVKPAEAPKLPTTIVSWLIDEKPAAWSEVFRLDAVAHIGPMKLRLVSRGAFNISLHVFTICLEGTKGTEIACCRELSNAVCLGEQKMATEIMRDKLIIAMGVYADRDAALLQAQVQR